MTTVTVMLALTLLCLAFQVPPSTCHWNGFNWWNFNNNNNNNNNNFNNNNQNCDNLLQTCMTQPLSQRLTARTNGAQTVSTTQDLVANFDINGDQCISAMEFNAVMTQRMFSTAYANYRFRALMGTVAVNAACPGGISVASLRAQPVTPGVAATINNNMVQSVINFCEQNIAFFRTNCDCIQLPSVCSMQPFQTTLACTVFTARYNNANNNIQCPFSYMGINLARNNCATGNFGTANAQMVPLIRLLCNKLTQINPVG